MAMVIMPSDQETWPIYSISAAVGTDPFGTSENVKNERSDILLLQWMFVQWRESPQYQLLGSRPSMDGILGQVTHYHITMAVLLLEPAARSAKPFLEPIPVYSSKTLSALMNANAMGALNAVVWPCQSKDGIHTSMPMELQEALRSNLKSS